MDPTYTARRDGMGSTGTDNLARGASGDIERRSVDGERDSGAGADTADREGDAGACVDVNECDDGTDDCIGFLRTPSRHFGESTLIVREDRATNLANLAWVAPSRAACRLQTCGLETR